MKAALACVVAIVVVVACFAAAGCGADDDSNESTAADGGDTSAGGVKKAEARIADFSEEPAWSPPGPAFDASKASGKTVWYVSIDQSIPILQTFTAELKTALDEANVGLEICDGKGTPTEWKRCFDLAVARGADLIIDESINPELVAGAVEKADARGIPVVDGNITDPAAEAFPGFAARVALPFRTAGSLVADWIIADSGGEANVLVLSTSDNPNAAQVADQGALAEFDRLCPDCKTRVEAVPTAQWATDLGTLTQSTLTSDPTIDYVLPIYDGMSTFILGPIRQAGATDRVKVATFNANLDPLKNMANGNLIHVDVGSNNAYVGWAYADQVLRLLSGVEPVEDEKVPLRVFTRENVGDLELTPAAERSGEWYGEPVFKDEFVKLWGLGGS